MSSLGYDCSYTTNGFTIHWSAGGAMPSNDCTAAAAGNASYTGMLHMAVSAATPGVWVERVSAKVVYALGCG